MAYNEPKQKFDQAFIKKSINGQLNVYSAQKIHNGYEMMKTHVDTNSLIATRFLECDEKKMNLS